MRRGVVLELYMAEPQRDEYAPLAEFIVHVNIQPDEKLSEQSTARGQSRHETKQSHHYSGS